jgi:hypothetical protein
MRLVAVGPEGSGQPIPVHIPPTTERKQSQQPEALARTKMRKRLPANPCCERSEEPDLERVRAGRRRAGIDRGLPGRLNRAWRRFLGAGFYVDRHGGIGLQRFVLEILPFRVHPRNARFG